MKRRNGFRCFECDSKANHAHHVVPYSLGGTRTIPLCEPCHTLVHKLDLTNHAELTKAGIKRAREAGGRHGRPERDLPIEKIKKLRASGENWLSISKKLDIPYSTLTYNKAKFK